MKLTVCFGDVRVVVPCGDGDFAVNELIQRAVARYKKATGKQKDCDVRVCVLKNLRDGGILDLDDLLSDVVDDRDQVFAEFVESPKGLKSLEAAVTYDAAGVVQKTKEARQGNVANHTLAATRLVVNHQDGRQDAAADDEASSSSSGEQDEHDELPAATVVVTKSDLDKDIGSKQSQLTVRRESEPCKTAVSTAVNQRQQAVADATSIGKLRISSAQMSGSTGKMPGSQLAEACAELSASSDEHTDDEDDDDEHADDASLPRLQRQPQQTSAAAAAAASTAWPDSASKPAPAAAVARLLGGFTRNSARQSLGSHNACAWTTAQERVQTRSADRPEAAAIAAADCPATAATDVAASAAAQQRPPAVAATTSTRRVPASLALAPVSAEGSGGCVWPSAAARHVVGSASPEHPKTPLAAARHSLSSPERSGEGGARTSSSSSSGSGGVASDASPVRDESNATKGSAQASQPGCTMTVKIGGSREHLGFHVAGYFQNGREAGLAIHHLEAGGRMEREGLIATGDIVQEVNGKSLIGVPLDKAKMMLREALDTGDAVLSIMKYRMTEAGSSCSPLASDARKVADSPLASTRLSTTSCKLPPQPPLRSPSTRLSYTLQNTNTSESTIDPPHLIGFDELAVDLVKGAEGLGFTISSREHLAAFNGGVAPVFVKTIMPFGAAVADGRLKCGDRLMNINGEDVSRRTQDDIVMLLRGTKQGSTVSIRVLRQQAMLDVPPLLHMPLSAAGSSPGSPADPTYENVLVKVADPAVEYGDILTFDIPTAGIMPGTLGISIKGETALVAEGVRDLGVFVKDIVTGGAAHLDGRLKPGDLLISVNSTTLQGLSNAAAMAVLRRAANECRAKCAVTVARRRQPMGVESEQKQLPQAVQLTQATSGVGAVSVGKQMEVLEQKSSEQHERGHSPAADLLSNPRSAPDGVVKAKASASGAATPDKESAVTSVEHQHQALGSEHGGRPPPSFPSSLPSPLPLPSGSRSSSLLLAGVPSSGRAAPDLFPAVDQPSDPALAQAPVSLHQSIVAGRPMPVPRKSTLGTAQARRLRQCNAATSPMQDDPTCLATQSAAGPSSSSCCCPGDGGSACAACLQQQQRRQWQLSPEPCSPQPPGSVGSGSPASSAVAAAASATWLPGSWREPASLLVGNDADIDEHTLPAASDFLNDSADAAAAALDSTTTSPSIDKVDAAIQCEATSSSGSLGRGRWEQRFHRDRSASGGAGVRRSTPRSQVSDFEKKERRKSELILSSPYPNLVTLAATAAASVTAPLYDDSEASADGGSRKRNDSLAGKAKDDKLADYGMSIAEAFAGGSPIGTTATADATAAAAAATTVAAAAAAPLQQQQDFDRPRPEWSAYAAASSPVSAWVERTLEHSRAQPSPTRMASVSRLPARSPSFTAAVPDLAAAELSWEEDDVGVQRPVAPNGPRTFLQRRAQSLDSLDSRGSGSLSPQNRSKFSSLESLKVEMKDSYDLSEEPQKTRRRVARGRACNESFRAAVDHSYDAPKALFMRAQGSKFDEVHDSGINPLSSSSSSSDHFLEADRKPPAVTSAATDSSKGAKKDKTKASAFFGHLFRIGKSRKSIEDRQKRLADKGASSSRQEDWMDGPTEWQAERARDGGSSSKADQALPRLQRNQQQGSWSYHGSTAKGGTAVVAPTMMNEYYQRLMEDQRLQMVLASAISNDTANHSADHVYVNWTLPSSRGTNKSSYVLPQQAAFSTESPSALAEPGQSKVKAKQKSEPDLVKHRVVPPPVVPSHREGLWSDRIYRLSERDLTTNHRAPAAVADWRSQQQQLAAAGLSGGHRRKKTAATKAAASASARRPLSLHDDTDALLMVAHRRAAAANDYDNLPAVNLTAQGLPKMAAEPSHRRPATAHAPPPPLRPADSYRTGGGAQAAAASSAPPPPSGRGTASARQTHRLSWCYDYSGSSSSDDYSYGKAGNAYISAPQGARKRAEAARV